MPTILENTVRKELGDVSRNSGVQSNANYKININRYPSDLGNSDLPHYVQFYINQRGKSTVNKNAKNQVGVVNRNPNSATADTSANGIKATAAIAAGAVTYGAARQLADQLATRFPRSGAAAIGSRVLPGILGVAAGAAIQFGDLLSPDVKTRLSDVITLHVQEPPTVRYSMEYANKDLGTIMGLITGDILKTQGAFDAASEAIMAFGMATAKLPGALGMTNIGAALSASTGKTLNPFQEVIFEYVDFRSFNFKYSFFPKSDIESNSVKDIINLFKYHMHPELSAGKMFFIYPSEFQIGYYYKGKKNQYFHQFAPCVLETMDVSYGADRLSTFKDGTPTEIHMSLTFRETELLTKNMITTKGNY